MPYKERKTRKIPVDSDVIYGKVPPQDVQIEKAVLAAVMIEKPAYETISEIVTAETFYTDAHKKIFTAITALALKNQPIDLLTVHSQLKADGTLEEVGGMHYVTGLQNDVIRATNLEAHARILQNLHKRRQMIILSGTSLNKAYDETCSTEELMAEHDQEFTRLQNQNVKTTLTHVSETMLEEVTRIEELRKQESHITGVPSGLNSLDQLTHGWQKNDLIILAARPSVGKTALALKFARYAVENPQHQGPVAFFSLEMSKGQLVTRLLSAESAVALDRISSGRLSHEDMAKLQRAAQKITTLPLYIDDTGSLGIMQLCAKARRVKRKHGLAMIVVDYIQLATSEAHSGNREQEISFISRKLKGLAKELEVPLIALCQLSRETEKRSDKRPILSDLRESGALEQDADLVCFVYRPEYYGVKEDHNGNSTSGVTYLKLAKHRSGALGEVTLAADLSCQRFYDREPEARKTAVNDFKPMPMFLEGKEIEDF